MRNVFTDYENGTDSLLVEFERLKYCPENEQIRVIKALVNNGKIEVKWIDEDQEANIVFASSGHEIKNFKLTKKQSL